MATARPGPISAVTVTLIYLATFLLCVVGAMWVLVGVFSLIVMDLCVGAVRGDLRQRLQRPRW